MKGQSDEHESESNSNSRTESIYSEEDSEADDDSDSFEGSQLSTKQTKKGDVGLIDTLQNQLNEDEIGDQERQKIGAKLNELLGPVAFTPTGAES